MGLLAYAQRWVGGFADNNAAKPVDAQFLNAVETALLGLLGANPTDGQVHVYDNALGRFKTVLLTNAHIDPAAAIAKSKLAALALTDADIAAGASISQSKLNLQADTLGRAIASGKRTTPLAVTSATFAGGSDILASALSFTADGVSDYMLRVSACDWFNNTGATRNFMAPVLDGAQAGRMADDTMTTANFPQAADFWGLIPAPSAGVHTVNARVWSTAGTATLDAGNGVGANLSPCFVGIYRI